MAFLYIIVVISKQNSSKTASKISKTDFCFVTCFYHLCDICMGHEEHDFLDRKTCFIDCRQTNLGGYGVSP